MEEELGQIQCKECVVRAHQVPAVEDESSEKHARCLSGGLCKRYKAVTLVHRLLPAVS